MCHVVFIAADVDLPLIAPTDPPTFSVTALAADEDGVRQHFPGLPNVRMAGSATGCGCDFHADSGDISRQRLVAYLAALPAGATVMLHSCWHGDWTEPARETIQLPLSALNRADAFAERRRIIVDRTCIQG